MLNVNTQIINPGMFKAMNNASQRDDILVKISELRSKTTLLKKQLCDLTHESNIWLENGDCLNLNRNNILKMVRAFKATRDKENQQFKRIKAEYVSLKSNILLKNKKITKLKNKLRDSQRTRYSKDDLEEKLTKLEWRVQTDLLSPKEEAVIITQIGNLERQLLVIKQLHSLKRELVSLTSLRSNSCNTLRVCISTSRKYHRKMLDKIREADDLRIEADEAHKKYLDCKKKVDLVNNRYVEMTNQINRLIYKIKEIEERRREKIVQKNIDELRKEAQRKIKEKKKLTFEEFRLLKMKDLQ